MLESNEAVLQAQPRKMEDLEGAVAPGGLLENGIMADEMAELHLNLESSLGDKPHKVVHFMASQHGEGVSTLVREYGWLAAKSFSKSVLIIDANPFPGGQREHFGIENGNGWEDTIGGPVRLEGALTRIGTDCLFVTGCSARQQAPAIAAALRLKEFVDLVRERFDLVLIDSAPATTAATFRFSRCSDGVVLVVEAEKTRWPVVQSVKNRLVGSDARILGLVINKRRNHIPPAIYSRLK